MRYQTEVLLSNYVLRRTSLEVLKAFIEDIDWDDMTIPRDERTILLNVEARLAGIDENLNEESDIRDYLITSTFIVYTNVTDAVVVTGQSNNYEGWNPLAQLDPFMQVIRA